MKKLLISTCVALALTFSVQAATTSFSVTSGAVSNISLLLGTGAKLSQIVLTSSSTTTGKAVLYDTTNIGLTNVVGAYTTITSYATNYVTTYTNYYGYTNSLTNISLVDITNSVAATTNALTPILTLTAPTNSTVTYSSLGVLFQNGITISNATSPGVGTITGTITYTQ